MITVTSSSNDHYKRFESLSTSRAIRKHGEFILMGEKLIREFLRKPGAYTVRSEIVAEGMIPLQNKSTVFEFSKELFKHIDVLGTHFNLLSISLPEIPAAVLDQEANGLELVCPLGDPSNLGSAIRSAVGFGVKKIILTDEAALPFHPKCVKASAGAVFHCEFVRTGPLASYRAAGTNAALDMHGTSVQSYAWPKNLRLIVGEEGPGLPTLPGVQKLSIPIDSVESLNASVAVGIALYAARR